MTNWCGSFFGRVSCGYAGQIQCLSVFAVKVLQNSVKQQMGWHSLQHHSVGPSATSFMKPDQMGEIILAPSRGFGVTNVMHQWFLPVIDKMVSRWSGITITVNGIRVLTYRPNPNPTWKEKSTEFNVGIDWSVLDNRPFGNCRFCIIRRQQICCGGGMTHHVLPTSIVRPLANVGEMRNMGIEVVLPYR